MDEKPVLLFWDKTPPYAVVAAAELVGFEIEVTPDPAANKDYVVHLKLPDGYGIALTVTCTPGSSADRPHAEP